MLDAVHQFSLFISQEQPSQLPVLIFELAPSNNVIVFTFPLHFLLLSQSGIYEYLALRTDKNPACRTRQSDLLKLQTLDYSLYLRFLTDEKYTNSGNNDLILLCIRFWIVIQTVHEIRIFTAFL
jgi:hypothetical protein